MKVAILGASKKVDRFSYKALKMLQNLGHQVFPVSPKMAEIDGVPVYSSLSEIKDDIHTLTMYVNAGVSSGLTEQIMNLKPQRVVFNPGSGNPDLQKQLIEAGVEVINDCTLVMLESNTF